MSDEKKRIKLSDDETDKVAGGQNYYDPNTREKILCEWCSNAATYIIRGHYCCMNHYGVANQQ